MKDVWQRLGAPLVAAILALVSAGPAPWWWSKVFVPPKLQSAELWSCGWGPEQDIDAGKPCNRADPLHFHFAVNDPKYCTSIDLSSKLHGAKLVAESVDLTYIGPREGAKFREGHPPEKIVATAVTDSKIAICGYYAKSSSWVNSDTMYKLEYRVKGGA